ncbi:hypothetical protein EJ110_NYTH21935 [Nymphaea thermarum]|nr:hypothetical protein EJ110_NYTH21935 [Nymphaea thermarum]
MEEQKTFVPSCFAGEKLTEDQPVAKKSGQSFVMSTYRTKIAGHGRLITVTWCKNLLAHGLSISIEGSSAGEDEHSCKVELKPWSFWRKQGSKCFQINGKPVDIFWDLKLAKFSSDPEPQGDYYVVIISDKEVTLHLGNMKKEAYRRTGARPSLLEAVLVSRKEHIFGKKRFTTKAKFDNKGAVHDISIEYTSINGVFSELDDPEMVIRVDGHLVMQVNHLQWNFRGNENINIDKVPVEVFWDVHDWLFSPGLRHALFIFKPCSSLQRSLSSSSSSSSLCSSSQLSSDFCLYIYAWKLE